MGKQIDLKGQHFGEWTAMEYVGNGYWTCYCSCGEKRNVKARDLIRGKSKSCGKSLHRKVSPNYQNLIGQRFGMLTVISRTENDKRGDAMFLCHCDCGKEKIISSHNLKSGNSKSCGCTKTTNIVGKRYGQLTVLREVPTTPSIKKAQGQQFECRCDCGNTIIIGRYRLLNRKSCGCLSKSGTRKTHGLANTRLYRVWTGMKTRCYNSKFPSYKDYGGKGIDICDEWRNDFMSFYNWAYTNGYDDKAEYGMCTIDRIDNGKGYSPDNCRWVSNRTQANNKTNNRLISYKGERYNMTQLANKYDIPLDILSHRLKCGWEIEKAIEMPIRHKK